MSSMPTITPRPRWIIAWYAAAAYSHHGDTATFTEHPRKERQQVALAACFRKATHDPVDEARQVSRDERLGVAAEPR